MRPDTERGSAKTLLCAGLLFCIGVILANLAGFASVADAQSIPAGSAPVTSDSESSVCQQAKATAAARGYPDTQSVITDQSTLQFEDHCVAAVLNPAVTNLGPHNPGSYLCVGKSSKVTVAGIGTITETAVPVTAVPAGTCSVVACSAPGAGGATSCIAANNLTSLNGTDITNALSAPGSLSPDSGITSFTLNSDGSIASESANTESVLDTGAGQQGLSGNTVSLDQGVGQSVPTSATPEGAQSIGETQAVSTQASDGSGAVTTGNGVSANASPDTVGVSADNGVPAQPTADTNGNIPVTNDAAPQQVSLRTNGEVPNQLPNADLNGPQPTTPTLNNGTGSIAPDNSELSNLLNSAANQPTDESWIDKVGTTLTNDGITAINDVRGWFGFGPLDFSAPQVEPVGMGIRG